MFPAHSGARPMSRSHRLRPFTLLLAIALVACVDPAADSAGPGARLSVTASRTEFYKGDDAQLTAVGASGRVAWTSADTMIATVDSVGLARGVRAGVTRITATAAQGSGGVDLTIREDALRPAVAGFTISPPAVDLASGPVTMQVTVPASDAESGIGALSISFNPPRTPLAHFQPFRCGAAALVSGSSADGTWRCTFTLNRYVPAGSWLISAYVYDVAGNMRELGKTFAVSGSLPDAVPPRLTSVVFGAETRNPSTGRRQVPVSLGVADGESGIGVLTMRYAGPTADPAAGECTNRGNLSAGSLNAGTMRCSLAIPGNHSGAWRISEVRLIDVRDNIRVYAGTDLAAAGFPTTVTFP